jgi:polycomb protein EED
MDNCVKVWATPPLANSMATAATWTKPLANFKTLIIDTPIFSSSSMHDDYVDCVGWLGDTVLSKSVNGVVKLWVPDEPVGVVHTRGNQLRSVATFEQKDANLWWIRFAVSGSRNAFALGNMKGLVLVWRLDDRGGLTREPARLAAFPVKRNATSTFVAPEFALDAHKVVRQCTISHDGDVVVAACDSGLICRWDLAPGDDDDDEVDDESEKIDGTSGHDVK